MSTKQWKRYGRDQEGDLQQDKLRLEESELLNYNIIFIQRETASQILLGSIC